MRFTITKEFAFEAAHQLYGLPEGHQCGRVHGHSYRTVVELGSEVLDPTGFVTDFGNLRAFGEYVAGALDHHDLNAVLDQPSSELLAVHLYDWISLHMPELRPFLLAVRVSETARSWAEYRP